jgi:1,4-alpha-glucan branching enzyme
VPAGGRWDEVLNSDAETYGGSGVGNLGGITATEDQWGGFQHCLEMTLPPLAVVAFRAAG